MARLKTIKASCSIPSSVTDPPFAIVKSCLDLWLILASPCKSSDNLDY